MSEYVAEAGPVETGQAVAGRTSEGTTAAGAGLSAWFATLLGFVLVPPRREERGMVTVEFIFGILIAIAIVTVVVTALGQKGMALFFVDLMKKLINLIFQGR